MSYEIQEEPKEPETLTPEEFLSKQRASIRKKSYWAIGIGGALVFLSVGAVFLVLYILPEQLAGGDSARSVTEILFKNILFLIGLFCLGGGIWGLRHANRIKIEDYIPTPEAVAFLEQVRETRPTYTYFLVGAIVAVYVAQMVTDAESAASGGLPRSIELAGLVKPLAWQGEWWRLLTGAALHGGLLHIYFNSQAFLGFGGMIEILANRAHVGLIFLLSALGGSLLSLVMLPDATSVGASGGVLGLVGYLAVYGQRRKTQLPPDFLKNMLINVGFIAAFGIVAWSIIDNWGHLGGFVVGAVYGLVQIPRGTLQDPRRVGTVVDALGLLSVGAVVTGCILVILLIIGKITFS